ncbi:hypothetical protein [Azoarcus sp. KH32C]|uniref:hypothetical protein n=1 Tax=Azoarcus sp. KH32C TaxID=748247 RepID=UPI0005A0BD67|nr:hypothetical protein [Azoarcus sp. KH32C]
MSNDLWSIFLNLVAAFIYAGIVWLWNRRGNRPPPSPPIQTPQRHEEELTPDRRAKNRQAAERAAYKFIFYLATFGALYLSVTMPPLFKALFAKTDVMLSDARVIGESLPAIPVGKSYLQVTFFGVTAVLYWPLLMLAELITSLLYPLIDAFRPVNERIWSATTMLVFYLFCIPVAATSVWLFYEKTFQDSFFTVLMALFVTFAIGQAQGGRR